MPKTILKKILSTWPDEDPEIIQSHLERLNDRYCTCFTAQDIQTHIQIISQLTPKEPIQLILNPLNKNELECIFITFNYPSLLSILTGLLSGMTYEIQSGDIFTYGTKDIHIPHHQRSYNRQKVLTNPKFRRFVIDRFVGQRISKLPYQKWVTDFKMHLAHVFGLLETQQSQSQLDAKQYVNTLVRNQIGSIPKDKSPILYPVQIDVDNDVNSMTRLTIISQDTPAFLYSLTYALSQQHISIEQVRIQTQKNQIKDVIDIVDEGGQKITSTDTLNQLKLFISLTKQFTYFIDRAPDPFAALQRFEQLLKEIISQGNQAKWIHLLSDPKALRDLATLLGASDYLWEDFIQIQYESLRPILKSHQSPQITLDDLKKLDQQLKNDIANLPTYSDKKKLLNRTKNQWLFQIDLQTILTNQDFKQLAIRLSALAELVIKHAVNIVYSNLCEQYGPPKTVAGLPAPYAVFGLGKMGGKALGYASDIELLVIFSDSGHTEGKKSIRNQEFYNELVQQLNLFIKAKRDGIFQLDFRLRPFGQDGPLAASLATFCDYYGANDQAHFMEKLALTRMRFLCGDSPLGQQIIRLRDQYIFHLSHIPIEQLWDLRKKQFIEKSMPGKLNAKFSPGALVDIEYAVQLLQVLYSKDFPTLKTPSMYEALIELEQASIMEKQESLRLINAYNFFRQLVNGVRMLRGSAKDLFLPPIDSAEYTHLARRIGYSKKNQLEPAQQLHLDFDMHTAIVRTFVEKYFTRESLPAQNIGNIVDLIILEDPPLELRQKILSEAGFLDINKAFTNFKTLASHPEQQQIFTRLAVLACDILQQQPDPDLALNNWERFCEHLEDKTEHFQLLLQQPKRLTILLRLFSLSYYLTNTLIRHPEFFNWATNPKRIYEPTSNVESIQTWVEQQHLGFSQQLRRYKHCEMLRIGIRDLCLEYSLPTIASDLSTLADRLVQAALANAMATELTPDQIPIYTSQLSILAFGKLGGQELNYSSDIDLVAVYKTTDDIDAIKLNQILLNMTQLLCDYTDEGYVYRVDFRLRPYGQSGALASTIDQLQNYYQTSAHLWEIQALLKLRFIAGDTDLGKSVISLAKTIINKPIEPKKIRSSIIEMRKKSQKAHKPKKASSIDIKNGLGGIRDIEFLVQGLQMIHAQKHPDCLSGNTLQALALLNQFQILDIDTATELKTNYHFLRTVEHLLQLFEDRQIKNLPNYPDVLNRIGKRMSNPKNPTQLWEMISSILSRNYDYFRIYIKEETQCLPK